MSEHGESIPYIGVSGVVDAYQQEIVAQLSDSSGLFDMGRALVLGVKATHKTQILDIENKYGPEWYPVGGQEFSRAIDPGVTPGKPIIGVAQAYLEKDLAGDPDYRNRFVSRLAERGAPWLQGIQFDMLPWHTDESMLPFLEKIKDEHGLKIFLQCHNNAMDELGSSGVAHRLHRYGTAIDYLLFDASHGTGKRLDVDRLRSFVGSIYVSSWLGHVGVAVAGGLDAVTVREELPRLLDDFPDVSWDAEGRLHPATPRGTRPLDMRAVREYLRASAEVLAAYSQPAPASSESEQ